MFNITHISLSSASRFYDKEVFPADESELVYIPLEDVVGYVSMLHRKDYFSGRPRNPDISNRDTYLFEFYYDVELEQHPNENCHLPVFERRGDTKEQVAFQYFQPNKKAWAWKEFRTPVKVFKRHLTIDQVKFGDQYQLIDNTFTSDMFGNGDDDDDDDSNSESGDSGGSRDSGNSDASSDDDRRRRNKRAAKKKATGTKNNAIDVDADDIETID